MLYLALLDQVPFFWDFTAEEKAIIASNENFFAAFSDNDVLITEGDEEDDALFILIKGTVVVTTNAIPDQVLVSLEAGAVMGEISYLTRRKRATNIVAKGDVIAFRINREILVLENLDSQLINKINTQLIEILVKRLEETNKLLASQKEANLLLTKALGTKFLQ